MTFSRCAAFAIARMVFLIVTLSQQQSIIADSRHLLPAEGQENWGLDVTDAT